MKKQAYEISQIGLDEMAEMYVIETMHNETSAIKDAFIAGAVYTTNKPAEYKTLNDYEDILATATEGLKGLFDNEVYIPFDKALEAITVAANKSAEAEKERIVKLFERFIEENDCWQERYTDLLTKIKQ